MFSGALAILAFNAIVTLDARTVISDCKFDTNGLAKFWQGKDPLIPIQDKISNKFYVDLKAGSFFSVDCGENSRLKTSTDFQCIMGDIVQSSNGVNQRFEEIFNCKKPSSYKFKETVYRNGTCYNGYTNIVIELKNAADSYALTTICHNEETSETLFAKSWIRGFDLDASEPISRPSFKEAGFYPKISANECYTKIGQFDTVATLLGSEEQASQYLQPEKNVFLSRGHLMPNGDGIEGYEKKATFYYVNVVGQWQSINAGNWQRLEFMARKIAEQRQAKLTVYTGAYGVTTLPDVNNNPVEIWLGRDDYGHLVKKIPVPHLTWKVIHDEARQDAVAVIQMNNPWTVPSSGDIICPDLCDKLDWVNWDTSNVRLGFTYCCNVADFHKAVPFAPNLGNLTVLNEFFDDDF